MATTDTKKRMGRLPPLTLALVVISFVLVFTCIAGLLFPQHQRIEAAKKDRAAKTLLLEEQQKLFPLFARAEALEKIAFEPVLPLVERKPLDREQIGGLSGIFSDIADSHNMKLSGNSLDINSLQNESGSISMDVQFTGDLFDFRNCLVSLARMPCFKGIEGVKIETDTNNIKTFSTRLLIAIKKK